MKPAILFLCMFIIGAELLAQDKPKPIQTISLSRDSVSTRIGLINNAITERQKLIEQYQDEIKNLVGIRTGLMMGLNDKSLQVPQDSTLTIQNKRK